MMARTLLALILMAAGLLKLPDPTAFADGIWGFRLVPQILIAPLAAGIPLFEIATGLGLLAPRFRSAASLSACFLTAGLVLFYAWAVVRGLSVNCSCFGSLAILRVSAAGGLARAAVLLLLACFVRAAELRRPGV